MTQTEESGFGDLAWAAIGRTGLQLSDTEREVLSELIAQGEARLQSDLRRDAVDPDFDARLAADELARRLARHQGAVPDEADRGLVADSIREWICPLYPIC